MLKKTKKKTVTTLTYSKYVKSQTPYKTIKKMEKKINITPFFDKCCNVFQSMGRGLSSACARVTISKYVNVITHVSDLSLKPQAKMVAYWRQAGLR